MCGASLARRTKGRLCRPHYDAALAAKAASRPPVPVGPMPAYLQDPFYLQRALATAARATGLSRREIISPSRNARCVRARWAVMLGMKNRGHSLSGIGRRLQRSHATVLHGLGMAPEIAKRDATFSELISAVLDA